MKIDSVAALHDFAVSFWQVRALQTAVGLRLFTCIGKEGVEDAELASRLNTDLRATGFLLNALVSLGLLSKESGTFRNTGLSRTYLDETSPDFAGNIIHHYNLMYNDWGRLEEAVRTGKPVLRREERTPEMNLRFQMGMHDLAMRGAGILAAGLDLSRRKTMLDLGGGPGTYAIHFCRKNPELRATIVDLPYAEPTARQNIEAFGLGDRVTFLPLDFKDHLPQGPFEVTFISQVLDGMGPEEAAMFLKAVYPVVSPGGEVVIHEFLLDEERTAPLFAALFCLNMLLRSPGGQAYVFNEIKGWLECAGFVNVRREEYDLPYGGNIVKAEKPT